jgi:hypothetical protein
MCIKSKKSVRSIVAEIEVAEKYATPWSNYKTRILSIESSAVNHYIDS